MLLLGTALISLMGIKSSLEKKVISKQEKTIYLISKDGGIWPKEAFNAIKTAKITETVDASREIKEKADVKYVKHKEVETNDPSLTIVAYSDSTRIKSFNEKQLLLASGRGLKNDDVNKILVHESFAKLNQLKIGSYLTVKGRKLEIIGLFKQSGKATAIQKSTIENTIITNENVINSLNGKQGYSTIVLTVKESKLVNSVIESIKQWRLDWSKLSVKTAVDFHGETYKNIVTLYYLVSKIIIIVAIFATTILVVILKRWIANRVRETGILLSVGKSKLEIIGHYLIEVVLVSSVSFGISIVFGTLVGQQLFKTLMAQINGGVVSSTFQESAIYAERFKDITITVGLQDVFSLYLMGTMICIIAVIVSAYSIVRLKPKQILTMMT